MIQGDTSRPIPMAAHFHRTDPGAWIRVTGEDAWEFLQSQFSNDLRPQGRQCTTYGLWLDRRGRVNADSLIFQEAGGELSLCSYYCSVRTILDKLERNVVADDVNFEDSTEDCVLYSLWGEESDEFLYGIGCHVPEAGDYTENLLGRVWRGRRSSGQNFDILTSKANEERLKRLVVRYLAENGGDWATEEEMHGERIRSRIPWVPADIGPGDLPQESELGRSAVSHAKGCYLGQEVMVRIHSMGQVQRKLCLVEGEMNSYTELLPHEVYVEGEAAGQLRSVARMEGRWRGHALLKKRLLEDGFVFSLDPEGEQVLVVVEGL